MTWDIWRRHRHSGAPGAASLRARRIASPLAVEPLEGRLLLSLYQGPTRSRPVFANGAYYKVTLTGPGFETVTPIGTGHHQQFAINLVGTTAQSTLSVSLLLPRRGFANAHSTLQIGRINVSSGQLGGVQLGAADLVGSITPLNGSVSTLQFNSIGPNAKVDVKGGLGSLNAGGVTLGPTGHIHVGSLGGPVSLGGLTLDGGQFTIDSNLTGPFNAGSVLIEHGGQFHVGSLGGPDSLGGLTLDGGQFTIDGNLTGPFNAGSVLIEHGGQFHVGSDITGAVTLGGLTLDSGGNLTVGRDLNGLNINGDALFTPSAGAIAVGGNLLNLTVGGIFQGKGTSAIDLSVGLDLTNFTVLHGSANLGGVRGANIDVGKDIVGLDIRHGIFNSLITAGALIDGAPQNSSTGGNIGPDGADAILDSQILAGVQIKNLTISGNVDSDFVTKNRPLNYRYRTRIVAGETLPPDTRDTLHGNYSNGGGRIDNFQITGDLIDSVVAAGVAPNGGNGTIAPPAYGAAPPASTNTPGDMENNTYDAPNGFIEGGNAVFLNGIPVNVQVQDQNYSEVSYFNETLTGVTYNTSIDPTIDDTILPGSINANFATAPATIPLIPTSTPSTIKLSLPSKPTVPNVISTPHGNNPDANDFAGFFAADTRGVFVGELPL